MNTFNTISVKSENTNVKGGWKLKARILFYEDNSGTAPLRQTIW
jgi:hypothetical protein